MWLGHSNVANPPCFTEDSICFGSEVITSFLKRVTIWKDQSAVCQELSMLC